MNNGDYQYHMTREELSTTAWLSLHSLPY
jgi:hypothetical protein